LLGQGVLFAAAAVRLASAMTAYDQLGGGDGRAELAAAAQVHRAAMPTAVEEGEMAARHARQTS
jgi:hypothetical protein